MRLRAAWKLRNGAFTIEFVFVAPIAFFLVFAIMEGSRLVFCYQEVTSLAREGARWASVHGFQYQYDNSSASSLPQKTAHDIYNNGIKPHTVLLDLTNVNGTGPMSHSVRWTDNGQNTVYYNYTTKQFQPTYVTVTVSYNWTPVAPLLPIGPIKLKSTSTVPITY